jgi:O-antigen/teichoic acid export membrane protein
VAATIQLALAAVFVVLALLLREPLEEDLFGGEATLYWILVAAVVAYAASYFARGYLAGHRRLGLYGLLVFLESVARVMFALLAVVGVATSVGFVALGMAVAPAVSLIVVPWALSRHLRPATPGTFSLREGTRFAGAVLVIMVCEQAFLNAGPLLVKSETGSLAIAGFAFNVVLILRAPLQLFQAIQTAILPHLTSLSATDAAADFRHAVNTTVRAIAAFAGVVTLALLAVGPWAMHLLFGDKGFDYDRWGLVAMGVGMGLYLVGATLNQAALAIGRTAQAAACWVSSAACFVTFLVLPLLDDKVLQLELAFLLGAVVLCATLHWLYRRTLARA